MPVPAPELDAQLRTLVTGILVDSVQGSASSSDSRIPEPVAEVLIAAAALHRIRPAVWRALDSDRLPEAAARELQGAVHQQRLRHLHTLADLDHVKKILESANIPWLVGKGPVAAAHLWPSADMREYHDLDIYVSPADFPRAVSALTAAGCAGLDRNWPEMRRLMRAEYAMRGRYGTMLDVHWDIAVRPELRRHFHFDLTDMVARSRSVALGNGVYPTFDVVDGVLLLAFHAAQSGGNRLMWMADVWHATHEPGFSWNELAARTSRASAMTPVAIMLERVARLLPFTPGSEFTRQTRRVWPRVARLIDERAPAVFLPGDPHASGLLIGSARPTLVASVDATVRGRRHVRLGERHVARKGLEANPLDSDVPDEVARAEYMTAACSSAHSAST